MHGKPLSLTRSIVTDAINREGEGRMVKLLSRLMHRSEAFRANGDVKPCMVS
jgi:hypothetical protein